LRLSSDACRGDPFIDPRPTPYADPRRDPDLWTENFSVFGSAVLPSTIQRNRSPSRVQSSRSICGRRPRSRLGHSAPSAAAGPQSKRTDVRSSHQPRRPGESPRQAGLNPRWRSTSNERLIGLALLHLPSAEPIRGWRLPSRSTARTKAKLREWPQYTTTIWLPPDRNARRECTILSFVCSIISRSATSCVSSPKRRGRMRR